MEVYKAGGGHPSKQAIRRLRDEFEADPAWNPGNLPEEARQPGRPKVITPVQEAALAKSAMALTSKGVCAHCWLIHCPVQDSQPQP